MREGIIMTISVLYVLICPKTDQTERKKNLYDQDQLKVSSKPIYLYWSIHNKIASKVLQSQSKITSSICVKKIEVLSYSSHIVYFSVDRQILHMTLLFIKGKTWYWSKTSLESRIQNPWSSWLHLRHKNLQFQELWIPLT